MDINIFSNRFGRLMRCPKISRPTSALNTDTNPSPGTNHVLSTPSFTSFTSLQSQETSMSRISAFTKTISRRSFAKYDDAWMEYRSQHTDEHDFFKWWYYSWRENPDDKPSLWKRLKYFYKYAAVKEILLPGDVFQNILLGQKYNQHPSEHRAVYFLLVSILSYLHFIGMIVLICVVFVTGLCCFGVLWPQEMKVYLVTGPKEKSKDNLNQPKIEDQCQCQCQLLKDKVEKLERQNEEMKKHMKETKEECTKILSVLSQIWAEKHPSSIIQSDNFADIN